MAITVFFSILLWVFFLFKANKKLFFILLPTCYVAALLDVATDLLIAYYPIWNYSNHGLGQLLIQHTLMAFGIYFVTTYFFLQWLPGKQNFLPMIRYISTWVIYALIIEVIYLSFGELNYGLWWNLWFSALADYFLFSLFYFHHRWYAKHIRKATI